MASRLPSFHVPSIDVGATPTRIADATGRGWASVRAAWRRDPVAFAWLALWSPFWIASDAPAPGLPGTRRDGGVAPPTAAGAAIVERIDVVSRRFWISWFAGSIFRGVTLGLLLLATWSLIAALGPLTLPAWWTVTAVIVGGAVLGALHGWLLRPDRLMVARMLDHTFHLDERIVTAFDRDSDTSYVSRLQLADAANTLNDILQEIPRSSFVPVREAALCLVALGALVTTMLANVPQEPIDPMGSSPVPGFVPASDRLAVQEQPLPQTSRPQEPQSEASLVEMQEQAQRAQSAREDLAAIGAALQDNPLTQPAADSIANGSYAQAVDQLRGASSSVGTMPQEQRDALADNLDAAAGQLDETNPELAQAARDAADSLREGGPEAEQALNDLADQIDRAGEQAQQPGSSSTNLDESQPGDAQGESEGKEGSQSGSGENQQGGEQEQSSGEGTDPGEGSDAAPGVTNSNDESASSSQGGESGEGSASEQGGDAPQDGESSSGSSTNADSSGAGSDSEGQSGQQGEQTGAPDEETSASQGGGAGTGQSGANDQTEPGGQGPNASDTQDADPDAEVPQEGEAGDPPPSREDRGEEDDGTGSSSNSGESMELEGTSDENVPAGNNSGTSSLGSGSGSSTSSGDQGQGEIGVAGPDSNRVPENLRDIVQDYFDELQP